MNKKLKDMLKKADDRIYLLKEEQTKAFKLALIEDESLDKNAVIDKLLLENAELKVLFDDLNAELAKKLVRGHDTVIEIGKGFYVIHTNIKVLKDNRIKIKKDWEVSIGPDTTFSGIWPGTYRNKTVRTWFVESEGEYTYDPKDETPIEVKKQNEQLLSTGYLMAKSQLGASLIRDLGSRIEKWWKVLAPYAQAVLIVFIFAILMTQVNISH